MRHIRHFGAALWRADDAFTIRFSSGWVKIRDGEKRRDESDDRDARQKQGRRVASKLDKGYRRFKVPEVWLWRRNRLQIFVLNRAGNYEASRASRLLPKLDIGLLERCVAITSWRAARQTFRTAILKDV
jgi:hypothetical protein